MLPALLLSAAAWAADPASPPESGPAAGPAVATPTEARRPNVIVVLADDLDVPTWEKLEAVRAEYASRGTTFASYYVELSLCCPSRATLLRGQYAHDTGIYGNVLPSGGYEKFHADGLEASTLATWLHDGGYTTGLFGKYLNGYPADSDARKAPPGWDHWVVPASGDAYAGYDYILAADGRLERHRRRPQDFLTDVLSQKVDAFVEQAAKGDRPFFALVAPMAPHLPATPPPAHPDDFPYAIAPRPPSFDEADVSDKPKWVQEHEPIEPNGQAYLDAFERKRLRSTMGVADLVDRLTQTLDKAGVADRTVVIFTSDNGFHLGEHRLRIGKDTAYEEDLRVPLVAWGPGIRAGATVDAMAVNTDLAPTICELAGVVPPDFVDGRSLVPWLRGETPATWRQAFLIEHRAPMGQPDQPPVPTGTILEPDDEEQLEDGRGGGTRTKSRAPRRGPPFVGIHTRDRVFLTYDDGEQELYDLTADPFELSNLASTSPDDVSRLARWTTALAACHGSTCRALEDAPPPEPPPAGPPAPGVAP